MKPNWDVIDSISHCSYKAWQLSRSPKETTPSFTADNIIRLDRPDITARDKLVSSAYFLSERDGSVGPKETIEIEYGTAENERKARLRFSQYNIRAQKLLTLVNQSIGLETAPMFYRNKHCPECVFRDSCATKLKERDCISQLGGVTQKVLSRYHRKGIFSITQLSHTFRPRRRGRRPHISGTAFLWDLKALAIREQKVFVMHPPEIEKAETSIYLDFEGLPEEGYEYLIGVLVVSEGKEDEKHSFWAGGPEGERKIFEKLFALLDLYPDASIFHYGSYELKSLKRIGKKWNGVHSKPSQNAAKRMVNLLGYLRTHVYPPIYGNGLKELGNFLGIIWTYPDMDGRQSVYVRKEWESNESDALKQKLISYNLDDCIALASVRKWFDELVVNADTEKVCKVAEMKRRSPYKFHNNPEFSDDFQKVNKAAYFDYQRSKIYLRGDKVVSLPKRAVKDLNRPGKGIQAWNPKKVNKVVTAPFAERCTKCGNTKLYRLAKKTAKRQTDLKFTDYGVRQWVTEYRTGQWSCSRCRVRMNDENVKLLQYGDNLFAWAINLYVNYGLSYYHITDALMEQFGIWMNPLYLMQRKYKWIRRWQPELDYIKKTVLKSPVIHIDETSVRLNKDKGYVWTFATMHTVFYHFTYTRESDFIEKFLEGYKGVIVTDFFSAYDTLHIKRQKCLIHLIRDMNDDLFKNPFDQEYETMVREFGIMLRNIIDTIDRHGLKAKFLQKHLNTIGDYYRTRLDVPHKSELSLKCAKRLIRHWDEMWTFLEHDGIPWNNNNAEAAIKGFAQFRRRINGQISEKGLNEYLQLLSLSQTCRYRNISFLDFLRREAGIWENIHPEALPGFLPFSQARMYVRRLGFERRTEWAAWKKAGKRPTFIPSSPERVYVGKGWINLSDFLGFSYMPFAEARTYMRRLGLKNRDEYWVWLKSGKRPLSIPSVPEKIYKDAGWIDLGDWLGTGNKGQQKKKWMPYEQAKRYVQATGITTQVDYNEWRKSGARPETIPSSPLAVYGHEFEGWGKFLGTDRVANQNKHELYWSYTEAKDFLKPLSIQSVKHFNQLCILGIIPDKIPRRPYMYYKKHNEWVSFPDFYGK